MQLRCSCGAYLPDDARFCHKCGAPQFEEDIARLNAREEIAASIPVSMPDAVELSPTALISFRNTRAVIVSLAVAGAAFVFTCMAALISPYLWPLVLMGAGCLASVLYRGGSERPLSTAAGARLGWMTGLWLFAVFAVVGVSSTLYLASAAGEETVKQLKSMPQFSQLSLSDSHALLMSVLISAIPTFFMVTLLPGLGGILGAKLSRGRHSA